MYVESFPQFSDWFLPGILLFLAVLISGAVLGLFFGYLVAAFRHGPFEAFYVVAQVVAEAVPDFLHTSPRAGSWQWHAWRSKRRCDAGSCW